MPISNKSNSKSNHFYCHITTAQVPWWVKFLWACSRQCRKTTDNLHMDRQCKKNCTGAFTVLQTVQKKTQQFTYGQYIFTEYLQIALVSPEFQQTSNTEKLWYILGEKEKCIHLAAQYVHSCHQMRDNGWTLLTIYTSSLYSFNLLFFCFFCDKLGHVCLLFFPFFMNLYVCIICLLLWQHCDMLHSHANKAELNWIELNWIEREREREREGEREREHFLFESIQPFSDHSQITLYIKQSETSPTPIRTPYQMIKMMSFKWTENSATNTVRVTLIPNTGVP